MSLSERAKKLGGLILFLLLAPRLASVVWPESHFPARMNAVQSASTGGVLGAFGVFLESLGDSPTTDTADTSTSTEQFDAELHRFMDAISANESDTSGGYEAYNDSFGAYGKYQILPANWSPWAVEAGLPADAPQSPENQEIVAAHKFTMYYDQFHNWRDVAIAWFAGPDAVGDPAAENQSDGISTVRNYADRVVEHMQETG